MLDEGVTSIGDLGEIHLTHLGDCFGVFLSDLGWLRQNAVCGFETSAPACELKSVLRESIHHQLSHSHRLVMPRRCPHGEISALGSTVQDARVTSIIVLSKASTLGAAKLVNVFPTRKILRT